MYSTSTAVTNNNESNGSYMPVGINENVFLKSVEAKKSPNGHDFLEIIFEDNEDKTATMTEWKNEKSVWVKTDEDLQRRDNLQFGRIMQVINCYFPKIEGEFNTFKEMIDWVQATLSPMVATKKALRLKVVYDKNNYTQVSKNGIFVEPMDKEETEIKKFSRDSFERQVVADVEKSTDPLASATNADSTQASGSDDLPF